jgi:hypothetical protein
MYQCSDCGSQSQQYICPKHQTFTVKEPGVVVTPSTVSRESFDALFESHCRLGKQRDALVLQIEHDKKAYDSLAGSYNELVKTHDAALLQNSELREALESIVRVSKTPSTREIALMALEKCAIEKPKDEADQCFRIGCGWSRKLHGVPGETCGDFMEKREVSGPIFSAPTCSVCGSGITGGGADRNGVHQICAQGHKT